MKSLRSSPQDPSLYWFWIMKFGVIVQLSFRSTRSAARAPYVSIVL